MLFKIIAAATVTLGTAVSALAVGPVYEVRRVPISPRPDQFQLVRVDPARPAHRPYALTGRADAQRHPLTMGTQVFRKGERIR